jgi:hypothetical protein
MSIQKKALEIALRYEGTGEEPKGTNRGPMINQFLLSVGIKGAAPWCMAFVYWCFEQAAKELKKPNPLFKTGHVLTAWQRRKDKLGVKANPQPGDVFIMRVGTTGNGHTGIVERADEQFIYTIEGNTNDEGSREGFEVARRKRPRTQILAYLRADKA